MEMHPTHMRNDLLSLTCNEKIGKLCKRQQVYMVYMVYFPILPYWSE